MHRKGFEGMIRESKDMTANVKDINNHSEAVGRYVYDQTRYQKRAQCVTVAAGREGEAAPSVAAVESSDEVKKMREEREKQDQDIANEHAHRVLNKDKERKKNRSLRVKLKAEDLRFVQELIKSQEGNEIKKKTDGKFPGVF